jgi:predicted nucleic acid-binding protein
MFIIDTNILAAEILKEHERDKLTVSYLSFYRQIPIIKRVIPDFILNEFEKLMLQVIPSRYHLTSKEKQNLRSITVIYMKKIIDRETLMTPTVITIKVAFSIYLQNIHTHYISFTDCLLLAMAQQHGFTIVSKDERLNARAKELHIAYYEPQNKN